MSKNTGTSELINYFDLGVNGDVGISGNLTLDTIANAVIDTDKFLVSDNGIIKYRTGAELLSDIGGQGALTNPVTGTGTIGTIPIFTGSTTIGDSIIQANSTEVNIVGNGSELLFDSLGSTKNGGIGYTNDFVLNVYNSRGTGSAIELGNTNLNLNTNSTTRLTITDAGNVLIGNPPSNNGARLQVDGSVEVSINNAFRIDGGRFLLYNGGTFIGDIDNKGGAVYIREDGLNVITIEEQNTTFSGSVTARNTISISASTAGGTSSININGLGSGGTSVAGTRIDGIPEGSGPASSMGFVTRDIAGNRTEKMRITSSGLVGIGTASPGQLLTLGGTASPQLSIISSTTTGSSEIYFGDSGAVYRGFLGYQHNGDFMQFATAATERMRITSSGDVGIGISTPLQASANRRILTINGTSQAILNIAVGGVLAGSWYTDGSYNQLYAVGQLELVTGSSNPITFTPNNTERMRITSSGNVLIGTTSDSGSRLRISGGNLQIDGGFQRMYTYFIIVNPSTTGTITISSPTGTNMQGSMQVMAGGYGNSLSGNVTGLWMVGGLLFFNNASTSTITQIVNSVTANGSMSFQRSSDQYTVTLANTSSTQTKTFYVSVIINGT